MKSVSTEWMQRADRLAPERYGIPVLLLMENAGRAVADAAKKLLRRRGSVIVLCGGGNNGGDGIAAARTLHNHGYQVEVWLLKDPAAYKGSLALHYQMARRLGVCFKRMESLPPHRRLTRLNKAALIIDALLGTGTTGDLRSDVAIAIELINQSSRPVIAIDLPSGLDADTGKPLGPCVKAALTVTLAAAKPGLIKPQAMRFVGRLIVTEIGIPRQLLQLNT